MLLDQKRTKRTVQIVAILTSIAFAGVIFVVLGLIVFGGGGTTPQSELLDEARERVEREPRSADAHDQLASALAANDRFEEAIEAAETATDLAPNDFARLQTLVSLQLQQDRDEDAIVSLEEFTQRNPEHAEAFLALGQRADEADRNTLARLSYQRFLALDPDSASADAVRQRLEDLAPPRQIDVTPG